MLKHHRHARRRGPCGSGRAHRAAPRRVIVPAVGLHQTIDHLDQRRFSRTVFAQQRVHLARADVRTTRRCWPPRRDRPWSGPRRAASSGRPCHPAFSCRDALCRRCRKPPPRRWQWPAGVCPGRGRRSDRQCAEIWAFVWPKARSRDSKPRPFCGRPDQAQAGEAMRQQAVAQLQVERVGIGQDQMLGRAGQCGPASRDRPRAAACHTGGDHPSGKRSGATSTQVIAKSGQRGQHGHQARARHGRRPRSKVRSARCSTGSTIQPCTRTGRGHDPFAPRPRQQPLDGQAASARPSTARAITPGLRARAGCAASKTSVSSVTAPPQHWPSCGPSGYAVQACRRPASMPARRRIASHSSAPPPMVPRLPAARPASPPRPHAGPNPSCAAITTRATRAVRGHGVLPGRPGQTSPRCLRTAISTRSAVAGASRAG